MKKFRKCQLWILLPSLHSAVVFQVRVFSEKEAGVDEDADI